jgi:hypothetical protein
LKVKDSRGRKNVFGGKLSEPIAAGWDEKG